ncbi:MAG: DUF1295 domain-containing protein [Metamycoplasmataceae bacterium]
MEFINILWIFLISFAINYFFFIFAWIFKSDVFTDITYALSFSVLSLIFLIWKQNFHINQILIFILMNLWALRLGAYLFSRIIKIKVDHRFDKMRHSFWKFGSFWTLQAFLVFMTSLPGIMFLTIDDNILNENTWSNFASLILLLSLFGLVFETIGDYQKNIFYNKKIANNENIDGIFIKSGLWKITRHPNYFGESCFWYGISLSIITTVLISDTSWQKYLFIIFILSPIILNLSLIYVSGLKLLEEREWNKLKDNIDYQKYIKNTSMIIPFFGKKGKLSLLKREDNRELKNR